MVRLRAPSGDGEVLAEPDFAAVIRLVERNRRLLDRAELRIDGLPLCRLRAAARREVLGMTDPPGAEPSDAESADAEPAPRPADPDAPLLVSGHQPELAHPGVWVKNFALAALAARVGGVGLYLVADTDTLKTASLRVPTLTPGDPRSARLVTVPFDVETDPIPYEDRRVIDVARFRSVPDRVAAVVSSAWGFEPMLYRVWPQDTVAGARLADVFTRLRRRQERQWGCHNRELTVSRLARTEAFRRFAAHIRADRERFRRVYNAAIRSYRRTHRLRSRSHPAPELAEGELPFWARRPDGRREPATLATDPRDLRPRAFTLTLFVRLLLADLFIHGLGGGRYDEVTDAVIRDYFGMEPPGYQVVTATLRLPLPAFPATPDDLARAERQARDLCWNPQRYISPDDTAWRALLAEKAELIRRGPVTAGRAERRAWFRRLRDVTERLRPAVGDRLAHTRAECERLRAELLANAVLRRRDLPWVLYPEASLRPFLQRLLVP